MTPGKLWADADGRHFSEQSWIGQACWTSLSAGFAVGRSQQEPALSALVLSVPPSVHDDFGLRVAHCSARWRPWLDSGVGITILRTPSHLVLAVLDVAGHPDSGKLERAAKEGALYAVPVAEDLPEATPLIPIRCFRDVWSEAAGVRRLSAREFTEAIADLRADLRRPEVFAELNAFEQKAESVTVNVCLPI